MISLSNYNSISKNQILKTGNTINVKVNKNNIFIKLIIKPKNSINDLSMKENLVIPRNCNNYEKLANLANPRRINCRH